MKADERRKEIASLLLTHKEPITGKALSEKLGASRQIIVQDIAVLKAGGYDILSTHSGYVINNSPLAEKVFKLRHTSEQTYDELSTIVTLGGKIVDVFVRHKVYGKIEANLNIESMRDVDRFIGNIKSGKSTELMNITSGYHYHTVTADSEEILDTIENALSEKGYIVD